MIFKPLSREDLLARLGKLASKRVCVFRLWRMYAIHRRLNSLQRVAEGK